ncbi:Phosphotransferase enzyme family protein [Klenkia soli]|uniref:Phosphotransferase enzyme family protein n=1 Tax=Klenkia soli TaxID=1052260 RepID=A0A1H0R619_9ACTN|nr:phosphotransferase [Klenkia soli]SDP24941.1 Phosphotransferase enzyme family protein [Klenkia soli]
MTDLPGGCTLDQLTADLRRALDRPGLTVTGARCTPVDHDASAPTTSGLHRVTASTAADGDVHLVAKGLQAARHGLPPVIPSPARAHLDSVIPWRLEIDVLATPLAQRLPAGLAVPVVVAVHEHEDDRATLWMVDVDPVDAAWTTADTERAAHLLGRLAARRRHDPVPHFPGGDFLTAYCANQLDSWAVPHILDDATWTHPVLAPQADLRPALTALAGDRAGLLVELTTLPWLPAHGDATPMNLLRPRSAPDTFVAIDWATATPGPVGWDVVPLVFGRAEAGLADAAGLGAELDVALAAHAAGLQADGVEVSPGDLRRSVLTAALLRYPLTSLPLAVVDGMPEEPAHAARKAGFVRAVLALSGRPPTPRTPPG